MDRKEEKRAIINKLKGLKQYSNLKDEELEKIAEKRLAGKIIDSLVFVNLRDEKELAQQLYEQYTADWGELENIADKSVLLTIIDLEILNYKLKKKISEIEAQSKTDQSSGVIAKDLIEQLIRNTEVILKLKTSLGMTKAEREKSQSDLVLTLETLKRRFRDWINNPENKSNYTLVCPHCQKYVLIRRRIDKEKDEIKIHPFFIKGGLTFNKHLFELYKQGKITKEDIANVLDTHIDYVDWILNKIND